MLWDWGECVGELVEVIEEGLCKDCLNRGREPWERRAWRSRLLAPLDRAIIEWSNRLSCGRIVLILDSFRVCAVQNFVWKKTSSCTFQQSLPQPWKTCDIFLAKRADEHIIKAAEVSLHTLKSECWQRVVLCYFISRTRRITFLVFKTARVAQQDP